MFFKYCYALISSKISIIYYNEWDNYQTIIILLMLNQ